LSFPHRAQIREPLATPAPLSPAGGHFMRSADIGGKAAAARHSTGFQRAKIFKFDRFSADGFAPLMFR
jgi:hypothetical protein